MEITLPNSQGNQSFHSVAGKRSNGRAVYLGDPRLALLGRSPVGAEKSALTTPCPVAGGSVFSGKVQRYLCVAKTGTTVKREEVLEVLKEDTEIDLSNVDRPEGNQGTA